MARQACDAGSRPRCVVLCGVAKGAHDELNPFAQLLRKRRVKCAAAVGPVTGPAAVADSERGQAELAGEAAHAQRACVKGEEDMTIGVTVLKRRRRVEMAVGIGACRVVPMTHAEPLPSLFDPQRVHRVVHRGGKGSGHAVGQALRRDGGEGRAAAVITAAAGAEDQLERRRHVDELD